LIHRPAVGSTLGAKASSSVLSLADSSKHIVQIVQLLEERSMSFSFCLNKNEVLTLCGLSILYQGLDLKPGSSLMKDGQRLVCTVIKYLDKAQAPGAVDFRKLAASIILVDAAIAQRALEHSMGAPISSKAAPLPSMSRKEALQQASRYPLSDVELLQQQQERLRRSTMPNISMHGIGRHSNNSHSSLESIQSDSPMSRREYRSSSSSQLPPSHIPKRHSSSQKSKPNLDYLSLSNTAANSQPHSPPVARSSLNQKQSQVQQFYTPTYLSASPQKGSSVTPSEWESLLSTLDGGQSNIYDAVYGGPGLQLSSSNIPEPHVAGSVGSSYDNWSPEAWDMTALNMSDFDTCLSHPGTAQSVLSFSEESLSSGDDLGSADFGFANTNSCHGLTGGMDYRTGMLGGTVQGEEFLIEGLEGNFGL
jgi:hypothetical protein